MNETFFNNFLCNGKNGFAELSHGSLFSGIGGFELGQNGQQCLPIRTAI
jgi:hypothetical protein